MTTISKKQSLLMVTTAISLLLIIPGCSLFNKKSQPTQAGMMQEDDDGIQDSSPVVVTMDGKPLITQARLAREKQNIIDTQPQAKQIIESMPANVLDRQLAQGLASQEVITRYIKDNDIDDLPEYKQEFARALKTVEQALNAKFFTEKIAAGLSEKEVRDFYNANRDTMPYFIISRGGVVAQGASFATQAEAQEFLDKVKSMGGNISQAAKAANKESALQDFKLVHEQSMDLEPALRDKILGMQKVPSTELFALEDGTFWVVSATRKEETKYRDFEQAKNEVRQFLMQEFVAKELERLSREYNIVIDDAYFGPMPSQQELMNAMAAAQDQGGDMDMDMDGENDQEAHNHQTKAQVRTASAA